MAEQLSLAYRLYRMRRWAGVSCAKATAWACSLAWKNHQADKRRARILRREQVERAARQRL